MQNKCTKQSVDIESMNKQNILHRWCSLIFTLSSFSFRPKLGHILHRVVVTIFKKRKQWRVIHGRAVWTLTPRLCFRPRVTFLFVFLVTWQKLAAPSASVSVAGVEVLRERRAETFSPTTNTADIRDPGARRGGKAAARQKLPEKLETHSNTRRPTAASC